MEPGGEDPSGWSPAVRVFGADLYGGTSGIAWFLGQLAALTGEAPLLRTAEAAANHALDALTGVETLGYGYYSGASGAAYALIDLGERLGRPAWIEKGLAAFHAIAALPPSPHALDVIAGSAGLIPALLDIARRYDRPPLVDAARRHGENLLTTAIAEPQGHCWDTLHGSGQPPLTGYSHGVAGIVCALLELDHEVQDPRLREAALAGLRFERALFSPEHSNWPDLRDLSELSGLAKANAPDNGPSYNLAWCHGAPGILLGRLRCRALLDDPEVDAEIDAALRSTIASVQAFGNSPMSNLSLCHGEGGNADILLVAAELLQKQEIRAVAEELGSRALVAHHQHDRPWPCGVMDVGECPGLLLGLAGIGTLLLRLDGRANLRSPLIVWPQESRSIR